jgi:LysM repeat protein
MAEEIRNKFWRLRPKPDTTNQQDKRICGVGVKLAFGSSSSNNNDSTNNHTNIVVDSVLADGPAAKAGLQEGDIIIEVDGRSFVNNKSKTGRIGNIIPVTTPDDVANAIRGLADTTVVVVVERGDAGKEEKLELTMTREPIGVLVVPPSPTSESFTPKEGRTEKDMTAPSSPAAPYDEMPTVPVKAGASENIPDSSLELSIDELSSEQRIGHEGVITADLTSSLSESVDKFDNDAAPTIANASTAVSRSRPSSALSRASSLETKSFDEFDEDGTTESNSVNDGGGGGGGGASVVSESSQWEMLSERSGSAIVVSFSGSYCGSTSLYNNRCPSPSMLKNKFILMESNGEPYLNHVVLPTDTLQGLCLAYKISATRLRMENGFSGNSLQLAPKKLRIPTVTCMNNNTNNVSGGGVSNGETSSSSAINSNNKGMMIRCQDQSSREYKLYAFVADIETMELVEAKAYLDLANWDLEEALRSAREDEGWNHPETSANNNTDSASPIMMNAVAKPKTLTAWDIYTSAQPPFDGHGFELKDIKR